MKKIIALLLAVILTLSFAGCAAKNNKSSDKLKIGIIQYMNHPSLDNCYNGIMESLNASGLDFTVDYQTGSTNSAYADCTNFAKNMVADNCDIIIAIATPAAEVAFTATADTEIPVIFCAVSDPVKAKLVESNETPGDLCTGTADILDLEKQIDFIQAFQPDAKSIGILYTSSEDNSISNLARFKDICAKRNLQVVATAVQNAADIPSAADDLASKVDCINNFTDNNVVENLSVVLSAADKYGIPVYGSEEEQVKNGCLASASIDYVALGKATGNMAIDALKGADVKSMSVVEFSESTRVVNKSVLNKFGMTLPANYNDIITVE